jgi:hypothetical protein
MRRRVAVVALLVAGVCGSAWAETETMEVAVVVAEQQALRADIQAGEGRFGQMSKRKRDDLLSRQAKLLALLEGKRTTDELPMEQRVEAFNALEWIKGEVNGTAAEATVCRRERSLGSHRGTTKCMSAAEREEARRAAQQAAGAVDGKNLIPGS